MPDDQKPKGMSDAVRATIITGLFGLLTVLLTQWKSMPWNDSRASVEAVASIEAKPEPAKADPLPTRPAEVAEAGNAAGEPYAAVATSSDGRWGASLQPPSPLGPADTAQRAEADAARRCGADCEVAMSGKGQCVAIAESRVNGLWFGYAHGSDRAFVVREATAACAARAEAGSCKLEHADCI